MDAGPEWWGRVGWATCPSVGPGHRGAGSLTTQCEESLLSPMFMSHNQRYGKSCTGSKPAVSQRTPSAQSHTDTTLPASH